jgi:hypothetical protein
MWAALFHARSKTTMLWKKSRTAQLKADEKTVTALLTPRWREFYRAQPALSPIPLPEQIAAFSREAFYFIHERYPATANRPGVIVWGIIYTAIGGTHSEAELDDALEQLRLWFQRPLLNSAPP